MLYFQKFRAYQLNEGPWATRRTARYQHCYISCLDIGSPIEIKNTGKALAQDIESILERFKDIQKLKTDEALWLEQRRNSPILAPMDEQIPAPIKKNLSIAKSELNFSNPELRGQNVSYPNPDTNLPARFQTLSWVIEYWIHDVTTLILVARLNQIENDIHPENLAELLVLDQKLKQSNIKIKPVPNLGIEFEPEAKI